MRTIFTSEDVKNIVDNCFNGNLWLYKASKGSISYENANSEQILIKNIDDDTTQNKDLAEYLNVKFYNWKDRLVRKTDYRADESYTIFDEWVNSLNFSMDESYALVEILGQEITPSQDIDSAVVSSKITFLVQTDKLVNLDYYLAKIRNKYLGVPQEITNSYGEKISAYLLFGGLTYDTEPMTIQLGECVICSCNVTISYLTEALNSADTKIEISLDGDDVYVNGEIPENTKYLQMPITKSTFQNIFTAKALPKSERPDAVGSIVTAISQVHSFAFYDINKPLTMRFNDLFWSFGAEIRDGATLGEQTVNVPVYIRITSNGHWYVYKMVLADMQKTVNNGDFNICSLTLKGYAK